MKNITNHFKYTCIRYGRQLDLHCGSLDRFRESHSGWHRNSATLTSSTRLGAWSRVVTQSWCRVKITAWTMTMSILLRDSWLHAKVIVGTVAMVRDHGVVISVSLTAIRLAGAASLFVWLTNVPIEIKSFRGACSPSTSVACIINTTVNKACYFPQDWIRTIKSTFFTFRRAGKIW